MFLKQEMKKIQETKNRLTTCCDLRRQLVHIEARGIRSGMFNKASNLTLGLAVIKQIMEFLSERKGSSS